MWVNRDFAGVMWNSTQQALYVTIGKSILSLMAGPAFVYFEFRGRWLVFFLVPIPPRSPRSPPATHERRRGLDVWAVDLAAIIGSIRPAVILLLVQNPFLSGFALGQDE